MDIEEERIIRGTIQAIQQRGWVQGTNGTSDGRVCINGAVKVALGVSPQGGVFGAHRENLYNRVSALLHRHKPGWVQWNDAHGRTIEEVLRFLNDILEGETVAHAR